MSTAENVENSDSVRRGHKSLFLLGTIMFLLAAWLAVEYALNASFQTILVNLFQTNTSMLRITLLVFFGGSLVSIPFLRRRSKKREVPRTALRRFTAGRQAKVHALMLTQRPSRDSTFVIRKTKKRGRISRNRGGERLPATSPE